MQNHTITRRLRHRLAVLVLLATTGMFSITAVSPPAAQASASGDGSVTVATSTTPNGVFGWD